MGMSRVILTSSSRCLDIHKCEVRERTRFAMNLKRMWPRFCHFNEVNQTIAQAAAVSDLKSHQVRRINVVYVLVYTLVYIFFNEYY